MSARYILVVLGLLGWAGTPDLGAAQGGAAPGGGAYAPLGAIAPHAALSSPSLTAQGQEVYKSLLRARAAALGRQATNLYVALGEARDMLRRLSSDWEAAGLRVTLQDLRSAVQDGSRPLDTDPWDALVAEIDAVYGERQPEAVAQARQALLAGREAARRGDRATASRALDIVSGAPGLGDGEFPLAGVRKDVDAALKAADRKPPDWKAARHAIEHALAQIPWLKPAP